MNGLLEIGVETHGYRTSFGDNFYYFFMFCTVADVRKMQFNIYFADSARVRLHFFDNDCSGAINTEAMFSARDAHNR